MKKLVAKIARRLVGRKGAGRRSPCHPNVHPYPPKKYKLFVAKESNVSELKG